MEWLSACIAKHTRGPNAKLHGIQAVPLVLRRQKVLDTALHDRIIGKTVCHAGQNDEMQFHLAWSLLAIATWSDQLSWLLAFNGRD